MSLFDHSAIDYDSWCTTPIGSYVDSLEKQLIDEVAVSSPELVIAEGLRVLKKGGRLVVGMIGKQSEWAKMYETRAKQKKDSVFAHARFFSSKEIKNLSQTKPSILRYGLYIIPANYKNYEEADQIEKENKMLNQEKGAGYIVSRWDKS
ncbi:hypothetical protein [Alkalihalobacillus deserti]|uniref:hypothetical protein n=1 Tax=Alkalihalobacillus deserti TaxID=2879466 RepID=UPI001D15DF0A|nr:hypothetical protein [Alkalihalobacillus deserti]